MKFGKKTSDNKATKLNTNTGLGTGMTEFLNLYKNEPLANESEWPGKVEILLNLRSELIADGKENLWNEFTENKSDKACILQDAMHRFINKLPEDRKNARIRQSGKLVGELTRCRNDDFSPGQTRFKGIMMLVQRGVAAQSNQPRPRPYQN